MFRILSVAATSALAVAVVGIGVAHAADLPTPEGAVFTGEYAQYDCARALEQDLNALNGAAQGTCDPDGSGGWVLHIGTH